MTKICTDLQQSKRLVELGIDVNTANMYYQKVLPKSEKIEHNPKVGNPLESLEWYNKGYTHFGKEPLTLEEYCVPAWSLEALLNVIPKHIKDYNVLRIDISENDFAIWYDEIGYGVNSELPDITMESAVDACVEMILKLHEQKLL